jgi:hypothetical protein
MNFDWYLDRQIDDYCNAPQDLDERDIMLIAKKYDLELHLVQEGDCRLCERDHSGMEGA